MWRHAQTKTIWKRKRGQEKISKIGDSLLRKSLFFPAIRATQYNLKASNPIILAMEKRLLKAGMCKMLIVGAAMKKLA